MDIIELQQELTSINTKLDYLHNKLKYNLTDDERKNVYELIRMLDKRYRELENEFLNNLGESKRK